MKSLKRIVLCVLSLAAAEALPAQVRLSADFDTGSVGRLVQADTMCLHGGCPDSVRVLSLTVLSRVDPSNPVDKSVAPSSRWFHFRMEGVRNDMILLRIPNTEVVRPFYSYDGEEYMRFDRKENVYPHSINTVFERDTAYVAYFAPYTHARHESDLRRWSGSRYASCDSIGVSGEGRTISLLTVTDPQTPYKEKRKVWIHSRVHTSEAPASWHVKGLVDALLADTPLAAQIRRNAVFYIVPETNPDGVYGGCSRSVPSGINMEINWDRPDSLTTPEVLVLKRTVERLAADRPMDLGLNMHSQTAPHVTYWIHSAESTSPAYFRRQLLLSALTMNSTNLYAPGEQSFSNLKSIYPEGWYWSLFGEKMLALTFETPYTYYNNDPNGVWVTTENLAQLGEASLEAVSDMLGLGGTERMIADSEQMSVRGPWKTVCDERVFFGDSYMVAGDGGASVTFVWKGVPAGKYDIYRWVPGPQTANFSGDDNRWVLADSIVRRRKGRVSWSFRAAAAGDAADAVMLVRRR